MSVDPKANQNSAVAVDLLLVRDKNLAGELMKTTAADWFARKAQIKLDHPNPDDLAVHEWEWVPGQLVEPSQLPLKPKPRAAFVFAKYAGEAPNRVRVDPSKGINIRLLADHFEVMPLNGSVKVPETPKPPKK